MSNIFQVHLFSFWKYVYLFELMFSMCWPVSNVTTEADIDLTFCNIGFAGLSFVSYRMNWSVLFWFVFSKPIFASILYSSDYDYKSI